MRNTKKTLRLLCAIVLVTSSISQAQTSKKSRFAKDEKIEKYVLRPMPSYKQAAYVDIVGLALGDLHLGYNKVFARKFYWEAGLKTSMVGSSRFHFSNLYYAATKNDSINNRYTFEDTAMRTATIVGLHGGIHKCLFGNPLSSTVTIGLRGDYLLQNSSMAVTDRYNQVNRDFEFITNQKTQVFVINPVITNSTKISRTIQLDLSGFLSYSFIRAGKSDIPAFSNFGGKRPGIIIEARIKKLF